MLAQAAGSPKLGAVPTSGAPGAGRRLQTSLSGPPDGNSSRLEKIKGTRPCHWAALAVPRVTTRTWAVEGRYLGRLTQGFWSEGPNQAPRPPLPSQGPRICLSPRAPQSGDLQPPTLTPEVHSRVSKGACCPAVLEAPAHPRSQVDTSCPEGGSLVSTGAWRCEGSHSGQGVAGLALAAGW